MSKIRPLRKGNFSHWESISKITFRCMNCLRSVYRRSEPDSNYGPVVITILPVQGNRKLPIYGQKPIKPQLGSRRILA